MNKIKELTPYIVILIAVILIKIFIITPVRVNGSSMYPTLKDGDIMILNKFVYYFNDIKRDEIVVIKSMDKRIIKRVIGLPGETIKYENNKLYINDKEVEDKYNKIDEKDFIITLDKDEYFVMGDNRGDSLDSRYIGPINRKIILGKCKLTLFPFNRIGVKK